MEAQLRDTVAADVRGLATDANHMKQLQNDLQLWRDILTDLLGDVETQFTEKRAALLAAELESVRAGRAGQQDYLAAEHTYYKWAGAAGRFKRGIEQKLRTIKRQLQTQPAVRGEDLPPLVNRILQIIELCHEAAAVIPSDQGAWHQRYVKLLRRSN